MPFSTLFDLLHSLLGLLGVSTFERAVFFFFDTAASGLCQVVMRMVVLPGMIGYSPGQGGFVRRDSKLSHQVAENLRQY